MKEALRSALDSGEAKINGYPHSAGLVEARAAIAEMSSSDNYKLTHEVLLLYLRYYLSWSEILFSTLK